MSVLLVPMIEKYKEIDEIVRFLKFSEQNGELSRGADEHAHFLAVDRSLATLSYLYPYYYVVQQIKCKELHSYLLMYQLWFHCY